MNTKTAITDEELAELKLRNEQRAKELIERLGDKYLCHPHNAAINKSRNTQPYAWLTGAR